MTKYLAYLFLMILLSVSACTAQQKKEGNRLINESSPYLLQHAYNPVDWHPWGDEAMEKAQKENKLMIISVGYAACHWCHVMEHESFEDSAVAALMNANFVSIKVDREERPDVDNVYMDACQLMSREGCGWPLNAIVLPDGRPIFAGTYFPKDQWTNILRQISEFYEKTPEKAEEIAAQVTEGVRSLETIPLNTEPATFTQENLDEAYANFKPLIDVKLGGRKGAPKFPMPNNYQFLMRYFYLTGDTTVREAVLTTLEKMAAGGIYDQLGGGFARYSTDAEWKVPHFEKMLYDNGQLVSLYAEAFQLTHEPVFEQVIRETLDFIERELMDESGGFYSSLDADSEGEEGKFYVWTREEVETALGADATTFADYYDVRKSGNWEKGHSVLRMLRSKAEVAARNDISEDELNQLLVRSKEKLMKIRDGRVRPGLDDKVITSWNALMLKGYVDAYRALGDEAFLEMALKNATFLKAHAMQEDGRLNRIYKDGKSSINAFLDDYALTAEAFVSLYQVTFDEQWLRDAESLILYANANFIDEASGMFFYASSGDDPLIARKMETTDNVVPGSNSSMAKALFLLGTFLSNESYLDQSKQMLNNMRAEVVKNPPYYSNWLSTMIWQVKTPYEVAILGDDFATARKELDQQFLPTSFLLGGKTEGDLELLSYKLVPGQTTIYVCQNKVCKLPVTSVSEALNLIK